MNGQNYISAKVNLGLFNKSFRDIKEKGLPRAIIRGFSKTAHRGQIAAISHTKKVFKLHTNYILNGVKYVPEEKSVASKSNFRSDYKTFKAAIFIRGSNNANKSLEFLVLHEMSGTKRPHGKKRNIALPRPYLKTKKYQTGKGSVSKRWKPSKLLEYYNQHPRRTPGKKPKGHTKTPAFLISKGDSIRIARRKGKKPYPIFILYEFENTTKIKRTYHFVDTVTKAVLKHLVNDTQDQIRKIDVLKGYSTFASSFSGFFQKG